MKITLERDLVYPGGLQHFTATWRDGGTVHMVQGPLFGVELFGESAVHQFLAEAGAFSKLVMDKQEEIKRGKVR